MHARGGGPHGGVEPASGDVDGALQESNFIVGLDLAHEVDLRSRILDAANGLHPTLGQPATTLDQTGDYAINPIVGAQSVIDSVAIGQEFGQLRV